MEACLQGDGEADQSSALPLNYSWKFFWVMLHNIIVEPNSQIPNRSHKGSCHGPTSSQLNHPVHKRKCKFYKTDLCR